MMEKYLNLSQCICVIYNKDGGEVEEHIGVQKF